MTDVKKAFEIFGVGLAVVKDEKMNQDVKNGIINRMQTIKEHIAFLESRPNTEAAQAEAMAKYLKLTRELKAAEEEV